MSKPLIGKKIAVLVANGFNEKDLTQIQQLLLPLGADIRVVSMDHGLVNSWNGAGWGLNFAADKTLNAALAADFSMLIIPGGRRSLEKLKLTAHTKRFIGGFIESGKPVAALNDALAILTYIEKISGYAVSGPDSLREEAEATGARWSDANYEISENLITGFTGDVEGPTLLEALPDFLVSVGSFEEAVAA